MKMDAYKKARNLMDDINRIEKQINEVAKHNHWIAISTPDHPDLMYSTRFQGELIKWLSSKKEEYRREFDELA